jgi:hypothetical protein
VGWHVIWFVVVGVLFISMALAGSAVSRLPLTTAVLYLGVGVLLGPQVSGLLQLNVVTHAGGLERVTEIAVIVSMRPGEVVVLDHLRRPDISGTANVGSWPRSRLTSAWRAFRSSSLATLSTATALTSSPGRRYRCARPRPWPRRRRAASGALTGR